MHHNKTHKKYGKGVKAGTKKGGFGGSCAMKKGGSYNHAIRVYGNMDQQTSSAGNLIKMNSSVFKGGKYSKKNNKKLNKSKKNKK
jgi:hypothetical protein